MSHMPEDLSPLQGAASLFADVVAHIVKWRVDGDETLQLPLTNKLVQHGARVVVRLCKDVTHIIFQQKALASYEEKCAEEQKLRELYRKIRKVQPAPCVVSPLWVQQTLNQASRADEAQFIVKEPANPEFLYATLSARNQSSGKMVTGRRKSLLLRAPKVLEVDVDDEMFSSSQQIHKSRHGASSSHVSQQGQPLAHGRLVSAALVASSLRKQRAGKPPQHSKPKQPAARGSTGHPNACPMVAADPKPAASGFFLPGTKLPASTKPGMHEAANSLSGQRMAGSPSRQPTQQQDDRQFVSVDLATAYSPRPQAAARAASPAACPSSARVLQPVAMHVNGNHVSSPCPHNPCSGTAGISAIGKRRSCLESPSKTCPANAKQVLVEPDFSFDMPGAAAHRAAVLMNTGGLPKGDAAAAGKDQLAHIRGRKRWQCDSDNTPPASPAAKPGVQLAHDIAVPSMPNESRAARPVNNSLSSLLHQAMTSAVPAHVINGAKSRRKSTITTPFGLSGLTPSSSPHITPRGAMRTPAAITVPRMKGSSGAPTPVNSSGRSTPVTLMMAASRMASAACTPTLTLGKQLEGPGAAATPTLDVGSMPSAGTTPTLLGQPAMRKLSQHGDNAARSLGGADVAGKAAVGLPRHELAAGTPVDTAVGRMHADEVAHAATPWSVIDLSVSQEPSTLRTRTRAQGRGIAQSIKDASPAAAGNDVRRATAKGLEPPEDNPHERSMTAHQPQMQAQPSTSAAALHASAHKKVCQPAAYGMDGQSRTYDMACPPPAQGNGSLHDRSDPVPAPILPTAGAQMETNNAVALCVHEGSPARTFRNRFNGSGAGSQNPLQDSQHGAGDEEADVPAAQQALPATPLSVLRTASRVPAGSQIIGTPMTTPHYYTRLQRTRYGGMGLDLEALPPDHSFVVEEDGTVVVTLPMQDRMAAAAVHAIADEVTSPANQALRRSCRKAANAQAAPTTERLHGLHGMEGSAGDVVMVASMPGAAMHNRGDAQQFGVVSCEATGAVGAACRPILAATDNSRKRTAKAAELDDAESAGAGDSMAGPSASTSGLPAEHAYGSSAQPEAGGGSAARRSPPHKRRCLQAQAAQIQAAEPVVAAAVADARMHGDVGCTLSCEEATDAVEDCRQLTDKQARAHGRCAGGMLRTGGAPGKQVSAVGKPSSRALQQGSKPVAAAMGTGISTSKGASKPLKWKPASSRGGSGPLRQATLTPYFKSIAAKSAAAAAKPAVAAEQQQAGTSQAVAQLDLLTDNVLAVAADTSRNMAEEPRSQEQGKQAAGARYKYYLACTSVDAAFTDLLKVAVKQLGSAKLCVEGYEDGLVTHLVVGAERRTLKVLVAIANGAAFVTPNWVRDSLAAGAWLPDEGLYRASSSYADTANCVRLRLGQPQPPPRVLHGQAVTVHCMAGDGSASTKAAEHRTGLQRLVVVLGGKVVPPRSCSGICVLGGNVQVPRSLPPHTKVVHEEWLLKLAELQAPLDMEPFLVHGR